MKPTQIPLTHRSSQPTTAHRIQQMENLDLFKCKKCPNCILTNKYTLIRHTKTYKSNKMNHNKDDVERLTDTIPVPPLSIHNWDTS